jgi:hypothetical protein
LTKSRVVDILWPAMETINLLIGIAFLSLLFGLTFMSAAVFSKGLAGPPGYWGGGLMVIAIGFVLIGFQGRFLSDPPARLACAILMPCRFEFQ